MTVWHPVDKLISVWHQNYSRSGIKPQLVTNARKADGSQGNCWDTFTLNISSPFQEDFQLPTTNYRRVFGPFIGGSKQNGQGHCVWNRDEKLNRLPLRLNDLMQLLHRCLVSRRGLNPEQQLTIKCLWRETSTQITLALGRWAYLPTPRSEWGAF